MPVHYTKEEIRQANNVNLISYALMHGYFIKNSDQKTVRVGYDGGLFLFKDSNKYYHHATDTSGGPPAATVVDRAQK